MVDLQKIDLYLKNYCALKCLLTFVPDKDFN
jgi:hypothetical protein